MFSRETEERIRKEFSHLGSIYFNTAYFGPSPLSAKEKVEKALERELDPSFFPHDQWLNIPERIRTKGGQLIGVAPERMTHGTSAGDIVSIVANGYPFKKGAVVCSLDGDYPSTVLPWMRAQELGIVTFKALTFDGPGVPGLEWWEKNLPSETALVNLSLVAFDTGKRIDTISLGKYFRKKGVFLVLDATQGLGGLSLGPEELRWVDVLIFASYKWILGPYGHAFGFFSQRAVELIEHRGGTWTSRPGFQDVSNITRYTTETLGGARKYDRGQPSNMLAMACLEGSLDFLLSLGLEDIEKHNHALVDYFLAHYPKKKYNLITPENHRGNILCLKSRDGVESGRVEKKLKESNVDISVRQGNLRLSFHLFNTIGHVETLLEALDS